MIMRLPASQSKLQDVLTKLRRNSIVLEQPAEVDALQLTTAAVRVAGFSVGESGKSLETQVALRFEKDRAAILVALNPALLAILGYTPAFPAVLTADSWAAGGDLISVGLSDKLTPAQAKSVSDLEWLLDLHVVVVGLP
jgi:hypothetical protein